MNAITRTAAGFLAGLAVGFLATSARAQEAPGDWRGIYVGGGGMYSTVSVEVDFDDDCDGDCDWWGDYSAYDQGDGDFGWSLHLGWRLHRFFALEASYLETGTIRWEEDLVYMPEFDDYYNNRVDFSAQVAEISALGILPFLDAWEIYLRLGAGLWDGASKQRLDESFGPAVVTRRIDDSGTGFLGGVGIGVTLARALHLRLEVQSVTIDEDVLNARDDSSIESLLFELQYRFGAR